jgi:hypothetical protein
LAAGDGGHQGPVRWKRHREELEPAALLAETVAHHFDDWHVDGHTARFSVDGVDSAITCAVPETHELGAYWTATLYLRITGAGLGDAPVFASASGYGATGRSRSRRRSTGAASRSGSMAMTVRSARARATSTTPLTRAPGSAPATAG